MKNTVKRLICILLCFAMLIPLIVFPVDAANNDPSDESDSLISDGKNSVSTTDTFTKEGVGYIIKRTTQYIGARTYCVQFDISSSVTTEQSAEVRSSAHNGFFTVTQSGWYLLELWGGKGADGSESMFYILGLIPANQPGGNGGNGGYVYGKVWLEAGQTLVYSIGTNGTQTLSKDESSGGQNGDGGVHGEIGNKYVGTGGGYSALYLFNEGEFKEEWISDTSINIPEDIRLSRYVMIAGGGGGGGAGAGSATLNIDSGKPNGGAGGSSTKSYSAALTGSSYTVPGYVFSGANGQSSGDTTKYVGRGGTSTPGRVVETYGGDEDNFSQSGNDWTGLYRSGDPGAGGSGNLRGGGGGAGFTGASGGTMEALLLPTGVGGGGGGSSFIAASLNGKAIQFSNFNEKDKALEYISGVTGQSLGNSVGGCLEITYLGSGEDTIDKSDLDLSALTDVEFTVQLSRYFELLNESEFSSVSISADTGVTTAKITGLSILPKTVGSSSQQVATVRLYAKAREDFAGGNCVDMLPRTTVTDEDGSSKEVSSAHINLDDPQGDGELTFYASADKKHDFVNVQPSFVIRTNSYTTALAGNEYATSSLYIDDYASVRNSLTDNWQYDYISSISSYSVYDENGNEITASTVAAGEEGTTRKLPVKYTVTLSHAKDDVISVGPAYDTVVTYTKNAVLTVVLANEGELNDVFVRASKSLEYSGGKYNFDLDIEQYSDDIEFPYTTQTMNSGSKAEWTAPIGGWYYVQLWGGNGGSGGTATVAYKYLANQYGYGGSGGAGGYVSGYVYLAKGAKLVYSVGTAGSSGKSSTADLTGSSTSYASAYGTAGGGGTGTFIRLETESDDFMAAGGGGGGGGGAGIGGNGGGYAVANGASCATNSTISNTPLSTYTGSTTSSVGTTERKWVLVYTYSASGGPCGTSRGSYRNPLYEAGYDSTGAGKEPSLEAMQLAKSLKSTKSGSGGQVSITLLESETAAAEKDKLVGLEASVAFSRYFDLDPTSIQMSIGATYTSVNRIDNGDGTTTVNYTRTGLADENGDGTINSSDVSLIATFTYEIKTANDGVSTLVNISQTGYTVNLVQKKIDGVEHIQYVANPEFSFSLSPKAGFLGGNDVPILAQGLIEDPRNNPEKPEDMGVRIFQSSDALNLVESGPTDYANVEIEYDFSDIFSVNDKTIHLGESVNVSELYTYDMPIYADADWRAAFVDILPIPNESYSPTVTTEYTISPYISPKSEAVYATVVESVVSAGYPLISRVYVQMPISYQLENLSSDGAEWVTYQNGFEFTVSKASGYLLPDSVSVEYADGTAVSGSYWKYSKLTGKVTVSGSAVTKPIVVKASGVEQTFTVHYNYVIYDPSTNTDVRQEEVLVSGLKPGATIDYTWMNEVTADINANHKKAGHTFVWAFDSDDGNAPATMPANDLWVYGSYAKNRYTLTVNYICNGSATPPAADVYTGIEYGSAYSFLPPEIKGYLPDKAVISGIMGDSDTVITVTYDPSPNKLIVVYVTANNVELARESRDMVTDAVYSFETMYIEGYSKVSVLEGKMSGDESKIVYVECTPMQYSVIFDYKSEAGFEDATLDGGDQRLVEYDNQYGYNAETKTFDGLPTPERAGYEFVGWYLDKEYTNSVDESTVVKITENAVHLYAKWDVASFKLVVKYVFLYTAEDFLPGNGKYANDKEIQDELDALATTQTVDVRYGSEYIIELNEYEGYTSYRRFGLTGDNGQTAVLGVLKDTMPAQNTIITITYEINTYTVNFMDLPGQCVNYNDAPENGEDSVEMANDKADWKAVTWETVYVKHNVRPTYSKAEPEHDTRAAYTYEFSCWKSSFSGVNHALYAEFPVAVENVDYYAVYNAYENVISVSAQDLETKYFYSITQAVSYAEENIAQGVTLKLRRNSGNGNVILGDNYITDTEAVMEFGRTYTGSTEYTVIVDFGGYLLESASGKTVIKNITENSVIINLDLTDSTTSGVCGGVYSHTDGDANVVAIESDSGALNISASVIVRASSALGNAIGISIASTAADTSTVTASPVITVEAGEEAIGIYFADSSYTHTVSTSSSSYKITVNSTGKNAYGIKAKAYGYVSTYYGTIEVNGRETAYGIYNLPTVYLGSTSAINVTASGEGALACGLTGVGAGSASAGSELTVKAPNGAAYGMIVDKNYSVSAINITVGDEDDEGNIGAGGRDAVGIKVLDGATLTVSSNSLAVTVVGEKSATGIAIENGAEMKYSATSAAKLSVEATDGYAYGVLNEGTVSGIGFKIDVVATENAYGIYNLGGVISASGVTDTLDVVANSSGAQGIGLNNEGGSVGSEGETTDTSLKNGAFSGSSYGIYSDASGYVYVSGNNLFFKGADESSALEGEGIVVFAGYKEVYANAPRTGYYRLGMVRTLTFESNGGTSVASITQIYDTPIEEWPDNPYFLGYDFVEWQRENGEVYINTGYMPDEDITLYAVWDIIEYIYTLDTDYQSITVIFDNNTPLSSSLAHATQSYAMTETAQTFSFATSFLQKTIKSGSTLYIFTGWYKTPTRASDDYVALNGDLTPLDTDKDGYLTLYAGWLTITGVDTNSTSYTTFGTSATSVSLNKNYTSSSDAYYMYYVVPVDGDYSVQIKQGSSSSNYLKACYVVNYGDTNTVMRSNSGTTTSYVETSAVEAKAGDVIVVRWYSYYTSSSYSATVYAQLKKYPSDISSANNYKAYSSKTCKVPYVYKVTDGVVTLSIPQKTDYQFIGWAEAEGAIADDHLIIKLSPEMIATNPSWQNRGRLELCAAWEQTTWSESTASGREYSKEAFTSQIKRTIRDDATLTVWFASEYSVSRSSVFTFRSGLTAGTILTLIDRSGTVPVYYTYTVSGDELVHELEAASFVLMGDASQSYAGYSNSVILQICYANAEVTASSEAVGIIVDNLTPEIEVEYDFIKSETETVQKDGASFDYKTNHSVEISCEDIASKGFSSDDRVYIVISWGELSMAPGAVFKVGENMATLYGDRYALIDLKTTVGAFEGSAVIDILLETMMQNEFEGVEFRYDICVIPSKLASNPSAKDTFLVSRLKAVYRALQTVTLTETPSITVDDTTVIRVTAGERLTVDGITLPEGAESVLEIYVYALGISGDFYVSDGCLSLFDASFGYSVSDDGAILTDGEKELLTDGVFVAEVSNDALAGKYYLKFVFKDKYVYLPVRVIGS